MKMNWVLNAGLAYTGLMMMAACHGTGGTGGTTGTSTTSGAGGSAAACVVDTDCTAGEICDTTGTCVKMASCKSDTDCSGGQVCNVPNGVCEDSPAGCKMDSDCATGEVCDTSTGFCSPKPGTSCHQCACQLTLAMGGCANVCDSMQNGNPNSPNFCNGVSARPQCSACLKESCATAGAVPSDPSACM